MTPLQEFIAACRRATSQVQTPAECVGLLAPLMREAVLGAERFLQPGHLRDDPAGYARNLVWAAEDGTMSLFALVWNPGQWTPVHDHGSWGVVGVCRGVLHERNYIRTDGQAAADANIVLERGGIFLLSPGAVSTFVPVPDHIHVTGVPEDGSQAVSLHLYGRQMSDFHVYDREAGTRRRIAVAHHES